ncbi:MAG: protein kinase [Actinomycetota bacterium]|nr:protein kinase [Actinomycetota bacterium]
MTSELITLAERYVLESTIASGGMGTVWRARDDVLARPVAVKVLHTQLAEDAGFVERFRREALAAARLTHPNIVAIYDTGSDAGASDRVERHYIVMEFCSGGTLADLRDGNAPLDPLEVATIGASICDALSYAHRHDLVHRDIKPHNVLMASDGTLKVADFGIAKAAFATSDITTTGAILGTVTYLSPEQVHGREPGPASDLYSLGILIYELVCGRPPFEAETQIATAMAHTTTPPPPMRTIRADVPKGLETIVLKALEKQPQDRFGSADEMAAALRAATSGAPTSVIGAVPRPAERAAPPPASAPAEWRWLIPVVLLVLAAVVAIFMVPTLTDRDSEPGPSAGAELQAIEVEAASDFDPPPGDGTEHPEETLLAVDGNDSTSWSTETYSSPLQDQKEGVGLLLDLGEPRAVSEIVVRTSTPGFTYEVRSADDPAESLDGYEVRSDQNQAQVDDKITLDEEIEARYWLVWITSLIDEGTGSAEIAEVTFRGS